MRFHVVLFSILLLITAKADIQCDLCNNFQDAAMLETSNDLPLFVVPTDPFPTFLATTQDVADDLLTFVACSDSKCSADTTKVTQTQIVVDLMDVSPMSNGSYIIALLSEGQTLVIQCLNQQCTGSSTQQSVSWTKPLFMSVGVSQSNLPVLFGVTKSGFQLAMCETSSCSFYQEVTIPFTFPQKLFATAFGVDGHNNYLGLVSQTGSVEMLFCHDGGKECNHTVLYEDSVSQIYVWIPPGTHYSDGKSFPIIAYTSAPESAILFCLNDYCTRTSALSVGKTPIVISISFGPDQLPVVYFWDSLIGADNLNVVHCFDYICSTYSPPQVIMSDPSQTDALASTGTESAVTVGILLSQTLSTFNIQISYFCGPYVTSMMPSSAPVNTPTTVTLQGSFCEDSSSACRFGSQVATAESWSPTSVECNIKASQPATVAVSVGNDDFSNYSTFDQTFTFYVPNPSPSIVPSSTPASSSVTPSPAAASSSPSPSSAPSKGATPSPSVTPTPSQSVTTPSKQPTPSKEPTPSNEPSPSITPTPSIKPTPPPSPQNNKSAITVISIVLTSFFAVSVITTYAYFKWSTSRTYVPNRVAFNYDNVVTMLAIPIDFLSLCAFSTNIKSDWAQLIYKSTSSSIGELPSIPYLKLFWVVLGFTLFWSLYIIPYYVKTSFRGIQVPLVEYLQRTRQFFKTIYYPASLILNPGSTILFFPISNILLKMVSCEYKGNPPVLNMDSTVECWSGNQLWWSILTLCVFYLYFPLAINLMPRLQQASRTMDIKYNETVWLSCSNLIIQFLFISSLLKLVIVVINALFVDWELPRLTTVAAVSLILTVVNLEMQPCNTHRINSVRSAIYFSTCVCAMCSIWATFVAKDDLIPLFVLLGVWCLIIIVLILAQLGFVHNFINKKNYEMLGAMNNAQYVSQ